MKARIFFMLGSFFVFSFAACGDDGTGPDEGPQPIQTGRWSATTGFGSFEMVVASNADAISEIKYLFSDFSCGSGVTSNGSITVKQTPGWPIAERKFDIEGDLDPFGDEETIVISGTFGSSGQTASGSWSASWHGRTCSGSWSGEPM